MEDGIETKHFGVITRMVVVIVICLLTYDIIGDHGPAMSRIFMDVLLVLVVVAFSDDPNLRNPQGQIKECGHGGKSGGSRWCGG